MRYLFSVVIRFHWGQTVDRAVADLIPECEGTLTESLWFPSQQLEIFPDKDFVVNISFLSFPRCSDSGLQVCM